MKLRDNEKLLKRGLDNSALPPVEFKVIRRSYLPATHTYDIRFIKTDLFCPHCGVHDVWVDASEGDFYVGPEHRCGYCDSDFYLP